MNSSHWLALTMKGTSFAGWKKVTLHKAVKEAAW